MPHYTFSLLDAVDCLLHYALGDTKAAIYMTECDEQFTRMIDPYLLIDCSIAFLKMNERDKPTL